MKKSNAIFAILAMAIVAIAVAIVSCKKEKQEPTTINTEQSVQSTENMDEYLNSFKKKLLSAEKDGETIGLEQAQRDLGNLLNYDFGDANYASNVFQNDTLHLQLELTDGQIELYQLAEVYNEAIESILDIYHDCNLPEKSVYDITCKLSASVNKSSDSSDVEIIVTTRGDSGITYYSHDNYDWRPKNYAGTCDGQYVGYIGGPEIMVAWINASQQQMDCSNGRLYYTDVDHWYADGYKFYDAVNQCFRIYTSFAQDQDLVCISHDDMEYYYSQILYLYHQQSFGNHRILYSIINHKNYIHCYVPALDEVRDLYTWRVTIRHGKVNCTQEPPKN